MAAMGQSYRDAGSRGQNRESADASRKMEQIPRERSGLQERDETLKDHLLGSHHLSCSGSSVCEMWLLALGFP